jgi:hypothetical protein
MLRWLSLRGNQLASVPGDYLRGLRKLETLNLSGNKLGSLPENLPLLAALSTLDGSAKSNRTEQSALAAAHHCPLFSVAGLLVDLRVRSCCIPSAERTIEANHAIPPPPLLIFSKPTQRPTTRCSWCPRR